MCPLYQIQVQVIRQIVKEKKCLRKREFMQNNSDLRKLSVQKGFGLTKWWSKMKQKRLVELYKVLLNLNIWMNLILWKMDHCMINLGQDVTWKNFISLCNIPYSSAQFVKKHGQSPVNQNPVAVISALAVLGIKTHQKNSLMQTAWFQDQYLLSCKA